ncbi:MAG: response regulator [Patescibacteria group bacterium]
MDTQPTKKSVLIAEDETALRELYMSLLQKEGYEVVGVDNGEAAYGVLLARHFDLLLLDILMPKLTGLELLDRLQRESKLDAASKIVMLTNLSDDTRIAESLRYGIRGYMVKSNYTPDIFIKEVKHYVES